MNHPLTPNLRELSDADLLKKISELQKRHAQSWQFGNAQLAQQVEMLLEDYKEEQGRRDRERWEKMAEQQKDKGKDWDDLIDV